VDRTAPHTREAKQQIKHELRPGWLAAFLPAEVRDPNHPTPPVVKAVVPLTTAEPGGAFDQATSVLVVLDEPAYRAYGITEGLVAELMTTTDHSDVTSPVVEYGRDPILYVECPRGTPGTLALDGPYGFTNEPEASAPLFTASGPRQRGDRGTGCAAQSSAVQRRRTA